MIKNYEYEVRFRLKKANEIITKCMPNASNGVHLYAKVRGLYAKVRIIYYINVRQIEGCEKKYAIESLVRETSVLKVHSANFEIEIKRV